MTEEPGAGKPAYPTLDRWQAIINRLQRGELLIVTPPPDQPGRILLDRVASLLRADGHRATIISSERFR